MVKGRKYYLRVLTPYGMERIAGRYVGNNSRGVLRFCDPDDDSIEYEINDCCIFGVRTAIWPQHLVIGG